jgi:hypothetical protein
MAAANNQLGIQEENCFFHQFTFLSLIVLRSKEKETLYFFSNSVKTVLRFLSDCWCTGFALMRVRKVTVCALQGANQEAIDHEQACLWQEKLLFHIAIDFENSVIIPWMVIRGFEFLFLYRLLIIIS